MTIKRQPSNDSKVLENFIEMKLFGEKVEIITYAELSKAIGVSEIRDHRHMHMLKSARKRVVDRRKTLIKTVHKLGIRLTNEYAMNLQKARDHIRKTARRKIEETMNAVDGDSTIPNDKRIRIFAESSALGAVLQFTTKKSVNLIEKKVKDQGNILSVADTLKMFG